MAEGVRLLLQTHPAIQPRPINHSATSTRTTVNTTRSPLLSPAQVDLTLLQLPIGEGPPTVFDSDLDPLTSSDDEERPAKRIRRRAQSPLEPSPSVPQTSTHPLTPKIGPQTSKQRTPTKLHPSLPSRPTLDHSTSTRGLQSRTASAPSTSRSQKKPARGAGCKKKRDERKAAAHIEKFNKEATLIVAPVDISLEPRSHVYRGVPAATRGRADRPPSTPTSYVPAGKL